LGQTYLTKKVSAQDLHPDKRLRLRANIPQQEDCWFCYEPERTGIYEDVAQALLPLLDSIAEKYWITQKL
jgi:hypothetical protein